MIPAALKKSGGEFHDGDGGEHRRNCSAQEGFGKMSGQPFEIAFPVEDFVESRLDEKNGDEQGAEKRGKIFGYLFKFHLFW